MDRLEAGYNLGERSRVNRECRVGPVVAQRQPPVRRDAVSADTLSGNPHMGLLSRYTTYENPPNAVALADLRLPVLGTPSRGGASLALEVTTRQTPVYSPPITDSSWGERAQFALVAILLIVCGVVVRLRGGSAALTHPWSWYRD